MNKRLYKIEEGKKIGGVCGGFAEYLNIDPTIVRLLWAFAVLIYGAGILAYIIALIVMPSKSEVIREEEMKQKQKKSAGKKNTSKEEKETKEEK